MKSVEQRNLETDLRAAAAMRSATVSEKSFGHFQIRGRLLVNYYPFSRKRTAYVAATTHGQHNVSPTQAVEMAFTPPPIAPAAKKDARRGGRSKRQRKSLIKRDGAFCHWCGCMVTLQTSTVEHVIPLHRGGLDNSNNRVLACKPCNEARGHNMPELSK